MTWDIVCRRSDLQSSKPPKSTWPLSGGRDCGSDDTYYFDNNRRVLKSFFRIQSRRVYCITWDVSKYDRRGWVRPRRVLRSRAIIATAALAYNARVIVCQVVYADVSRGADGKFARTERDSRSRPLAADDTSGDCRRKSQRKLENVFYDGNWMKNNFLEKKNKKKIRAPRPSDAILQ